MSAVALDIILLESHEAALRALLHRDNGSEAAAYVLFGKAEIAAETGLIGLAVFAARGAIGVKCQP